jgi:hypothetical protein
MLPMLQRDPTLAPATKRAMPNTCLCIIVNVSIYVPDTEFLIPNTRQRFHIHTYTVHTCRHQKHPRATATALLDNGELEQTRQSCLCLRSHGCCLWARPCPCVAGIQACWRRSRRTTHTHPHTTQTHHLVPLGLLPPWDWRKQKHFFSAVRLLSCRRSGSGEPHGSAANLTPPAMAPLPPTAGVKGTPAMYLDSQRHASVMDKRAGPFTPGPAQANKSSTLLVQAVPQRQQTPTDGQ